MIGWGGTYGALRQAQQAARGAGQEGQPRAPALAVAARARPREVIHNFKHVIVAELNMGQLRQVIRAEFLVDAIGLNKIQGQPFKVREVVAAIETARLAGTRRSQACQSHAAPGERVGQP